MPGWSQQAELLATAGSKKLLRDLRDVRDSEMITCWWAAASSKSLCRPSDLVGSFRLPAVQ